MSMSMTRSWMQRTCLSAAVAAAIATPALGADMAAKDAEFPGFEPGAAIKNGFSAEDLRDAEVRGANGDKIGEVEDLIIDRAASCAGSWCRSTKDF